MPPLNTHADARSTPGVADEELVRRFLAGDRPAYEALVRRHQDRVYSMCVRMIRDRAVAEELAQEVFVNVYRNLHRFRFDSRFTTWLYRVVINHCKNKMTYHHRRHLERHESLDAPIPARDGEVRRELPDPKVGAEERLLDRELYEALERGISELADDQRTIVLLRDVEGLSYDEIGRSLELAEGTVKSRLHRARNELKARLQGLLSARGR